jgi:hypothetical protein
MKWFPELFQVPTIFNIRNVGGLGPATRMKYAESPIRAEPLEGRVLLSMGPIGPEFRVNTSTIQSQRVPTVAMDSGGDFVAAWTSYGQDGDNWGIYAQRYDAEGIARGAEFKVNSYTTNRQEFPSIAMDSDGDFVVAWESYDQDGRRSGIYAQRYDAAGIAKGAEFRVNTYTPNNQVYPAVAMDSVGDFVVAWRSPQDGSGYGVYAQRYSATGAPQGTEFRVNSTTLGEQYRPAVAMDAAGNFVVTWWSLGDGSDDGVYAQRYNTAGVAEGGEFRVNTYTTRFQTNPTVAMDLAGDFVVAWQSYRQDGEGYGVYAQRYNAAGLAQGSEFRVNNYTTNAQFAPTIAMDSTGDFLVAWTSYGQDGSGYGTYAQRFNAAGVAQDPEFKVNTYTTGKQETPAAAMDSNGEFVVAWASRDQDGSFYGIYARRYARVPGVTAASFFSDTAPHQMRFSFDETVSGSLGTDDLVVQDLTTAQTVPPDDFSVSYNLATNTATFSYIGGGGQTGVLLDGNYRATLIASGITIPNGNPLPADYVFDFFFLRGDTNHDGQVNLADFNILASNFGQSPRTFSQGDFNYDGIVNLADFNILASRFGTGLSPATFGGGRIGLARKTDHPDLLDLVS